ncbi:hypothetical protein N7509_005976 [Penicillium cosmopolitanum]|uniref:Zn(2)-C6 fungal-type domain-containing protein n=1 Tax=Penicillium cosmopolitanum TaxID=1131564 RepID=A0A9X0BAL5_9EURO|nr:uncharacterized protein N7509_005976 [Penicillium cosmopolitanum]KAJ5397863.1 hypothetical protein N7509_005976 [Penicillium cosmopolitanum]
MNLTTRAQSKSQSPRVDSRTSTPKSQKGNSPRAAGTNRKKSELSDTKAKRVRTGCLTCRERHLKCDEALGRRGVRLNFIDIQTVAPPHIIDRPKGAKVTFRDDSRFIASEYVGGFERYPPPQPESPVQDRQLLHQDAFNALGTDYLTSLFQSVAHSFDPTGFDVPHDFIVGPDTWHEPHIVPGEELLPHGTSNFARKLAMKQYSSSSLSDPEQIFLLQTFVEEVGPWMESMDPMRHFTQTLPYYTVEEPLLLKAFLACGARHLSVVNPSSGDEKANRYYEMATQDLMSLMQDPNRDSVLCAAAALVLSIYESISSQSTPKINHTTGSRALIRECGWNSKTPGLGGACFWINTSIELLSCLRYGWSLSWDPDTWGVDMHIDNVHHFPKSEELWLHRILYICGKVSNFRVQSQNQQSPNGTDAHMGQLSQKLQDWGHYNSWCDQWVKNTPPSMQPLGHVQPWPSNTQSVFPTIWMTKRPAIIAQFFYHLARILLARTHPMEPDFRTEMKEMQQAHAYDICGLAVGLKDRGLAKISIRCLAIAAESLESREAQEEALRILTATAKDTIWSSQSIENDLRQHWGWPPPPHETVDPMQMHNSHYHELDQTISKGPKISTHLSNPLLGMSDFSAEKHPYQGFYTAPHHTLDQYHQYGSYIL